MVDRRTYHRREGDRPHKKNWKDRLDRHAAISLIAFLLLITFLFMLGTERSPKVIIEKAVEAISAATMDLIFGYMRAQP